MREWFNRCTDTVALFLVTTLLTFAIVSFRAALISSRYFNLRSDLLQKNNDVISLMNAHNPENEKVSLQ